MARAGGERRPVPGRQAEAIFQPPRFGAVGIARDLLRGDQVVRLRLPALRVPLHVRPLPWREGPPRVHSRQPPTIAMPVTTASAGSFLATSAAVSSSSS